MLAFLRIQLLIPTRIPAKLFVHQGPYHRWYSGVTGRIEIRCQEDVRDRWLFNDMSAEAGVGWMLITVCVTTGITIVCFPRFAVTVWGRRPS
jgi:hypothetical protein